MRKSATRESDGRIFPVSALDNVKEAGPDELRLAERFYAMQVKQKDKAASHVERAPEKNRKTTTP